MESARCAVAVLICKIITASAFPAIESTNTASFTNDGDFCKPLVIAHRGASGYAPEHTLGSYSLAITMGADYIEPDLVITKDGYLVARHDNELSLTTDIAQRPEFSSKRRKQTVDNIELTGWFTEDFTLEEIKTLHAIERIPETRPGNARMNLAYKIPTLQEIIDLVKNFQVSQQRIIGIYPEIKHSTHFKNLGLPMEKLVVETFHRNGYRGQMAPVYIQSFEINNLKELNKITELRLLQLLESNKTHQPYDQIEMGADTTYGNMVTLDGLKEIAKYAYAVGPDKSYIIPRDENNNLGAVTNFVADAHAAGLKVHPYTFRAENTFLPTNLRSNSTNNAFGDLVGELKAFLAAGIDGLFSDQPDIPLRLRGICYNDRV